MLDSTINEIIADIRCHSDSTTLYQRTLDWCSALVPSQMVALTQIGCTRSAPRLLVSTNRPEVEKVLRAKLIPFLVKNVELHPQRKFLDSSPDHPVRKKDVPDAKCVFPMWDSEFYNLIGLPFAMVSRITCFKNVKYEITQLRDTDFSDTELRQQEICLHHIRNSFDFFHKWDNLCAREQMALDLSSHGLLNKEIADALSIGKETVKEYIQGATRKLGQKYASKARFWYASNCYRLHDYLGNRMPTKQPRKKEQGEEMMNPVQSNG